MGNGISSCFIPDSSLNKTAKLVDAQGNLRKLKLPAKAAELMLDEPGHIISAVEDLKRCRRVVAMRADDELSAGKVYVLVPIGRVHCKVTDSDMAIIEAACGRKNKRSGAKVSPDVTMTVAVTEMETEEEKDGEKGNRFPVCRVGNHRPWIPVLEPISE